MCPPYSVVTGLDMSNLVSGGLELVGNSCCEHVCHQGVMPSHDANNDDAEMMIKRAETKALQIEMPTLFLSLSHTRTLPVLRMSQKY